MKDLLDSIRQFIAHVRECDLVIERKYDDTTGTERIRVRLEERNAA